MIHATAYSPNGLLYDAYGVSPMYYGLETYFNAWVLCNGHGYYEGPFDTRSEAMTFAKKWAATFQP